AFRPAILDCDVTAFDPTEFAEASHKSSRPWSKARGARTQKPNSWKLTRLLRTRDERPRSRCAEKWHEFAPPHSPPRPVTSPTNGESSMCRAPNRVTKGAKAKGSPMSALGQKQTLGKVRLMSALPPKADIGATARHVRSNRQMRTTCQRQG